MTIDSGIPSSSAPTAMARPLPLFSSSDGCCSPGPLAVLRSVIGEVPVRCRVDSRAAQEAGGRRIEAAALIGLIHQVERERGDQDAAAEGHDPRDQPLRDPNKIADGGPDQEGRPGDEPPDGSPYPEWHAHPPRHRDVTERGYHRVGVGIFARCVVSDVTLVLHLSASGSAGVTAGSGAGRRTRARGSRRRGPRGTPSPGATRPAMASSMSRCDASGSWKPVSSPSTTRTPRSGVMTRSVQPRVAITRPCSSAAVSSARTTVVPTAITRRPVAARGLDGLGGGRRHRERLLVRRLVRLQAGDAGVQRQRREADARFCASRASTSGLNARPADGISAEPGSLA